MVIIPKRFETTITILKNIKDLSRITLTKLLNSFARKEQKKAMRGVVEEALLGKHKGCWRNKDNKDTEPLQKKNKNYRRDKSIGNIQNLSIN